MSTLLQAIAAVQPLLVAFVGYYLNRKVKKVQKTVNGHRMELLEQIDKLEGSLDAARTDATKRLDAQLADERTREPWASRSE